MGERIHCTPHRLTEHLLHLGTPVVSPSLIREISVWSIFLLNIRPGYKPPTPPPPSAQPDNKTVTQRSCGIRRSVAIRLKMSWQGAVSLFGQQLGRETPRQQIAGSLLIDHIAASTEILVHCISFLFCEPLPSLFCLVAKD